MKHTRILLLIALLAAAAVGSSRLDTATITVMNTNDNGTGSLRQALADAVDGDTINFNSSLNGQTITLTSGELLVDKRVTISGPGANTLAVDANHASRVFYIDSGKTVTISGLTIENGSVILPDDVGAGIYNHGATVTVSNCTVSNSTLSGNSATNSSGGGIYRNGYSGSATVTINNSTLSGNSASSGGGIISDGAGQNGSATLTINNSTLSGNSATAYLGTDGSGGGIASTGQQQGSAMVTINNSTLSGNSAIGSGGGIFNNGFAGSATLTVGSTILNAGASGANIFTFSGTVTSQGYNLSSDNASALLNQSTDQNSTDDVKPLGEQRLPDLYSCVVDRQPGD